MIPSVQQICARSALAYSLASSPMSSAGTPVSCSARSSVYGSTEAAYSSKPVVARRTNSVFTRPAWMISLAIAFASEMSEPTSMPSQASAHCADVVRRGSTTYIRAPRLIPRST